MFFRFLVVYIFLLTTLPIFCQISFSDFSVKNAIDSIVLNTYIQNRDFRYLFDSIPAYESDIESEEIAVLYFLSKGDYFLNSINRQDDLASENYLKALSISETLGNKLLESESLFKILEFQLYTDIHLFNSIDLFKRRAELGLSFHDELENEYLKLKEEYFRNYESYFELRESPDKYLKYLGKWYGLIEDVKSINDKTLLSRVELTFAGVLETLKKYEEAITFYNSSLKISSEISKFDFERSYFPNRANLFFLYLQKEEFENALNIHFEMPKNQLKMQGPDELKLYYEWVAQAFKEVGNSEKAAYFYTLSKEKSIESNTKKEAQKVSQIKSQYEKQKHESELSIWRKRLIIAASLIFLFGGVAFGNHRYQSLKKKAVESELQKTKIQATLDVTKAKMEGEQEERKVIASVLHDQVASLLTAADMHLTAAKKKVDPSESKSIEKADEIIKDVNEQVRNLSHQLVSPTLLKFGLVPAIDSLVDKMQNDKFSFSFDYEEGAERIKSSKEIFLFRSCSELMQNALKYCNGNRAVISLEQNTEFVRLTVGDNGTTNERHISNLGLGLSHIKNNTEALLGNFKIDTKDGFKVSISIPLT